MTTSERMRGVANRIMFSRYYIIFYLVMTGLSLGTVILSLLEGEFFGISRRIAAGLTGQTSHRMHQAVVPRPLGTSWRSSLMAVWFWKSELDGSGSAR